MRKRGFQLLMLFVALIGLSTNAQKKSNSFEIRIDKAMTDADFDKDIADAKKFDFDISVSGIKRNDKKEITALKISYKDKDGNSGNYNVSGDEAIQPISIKKQFNGKGKGFVNVNTISGNQDMMFADNFNGFDSFNGMNNLDKLLELNNGRMKELMEGKSFQFNDNGIDGNGMQSFKFNFGGNEEDMLKSNPDMKLEEEKREDDGTVTKKYSDGKGNTFMYSQRSSKMDGNSDDLQKFKEELKSTKKSKSSNDDIKDELDNLKKELDELKKDMKNEKTKKSKE